MYNSDATFWYERSVGFMDAILNFNLKDTYQNPKPGVTVYWLSGSAIKMFFYIYELVRGYTPEFYAYYTFRYLHFAAKFPLVLLGVLGSLFFYFILKKLFGNVFALLAFSLLVFQPFYLAVLRFFHGDGTLMILMGVSAVSLIYFLISEKKFYLFFSAVIAGLAFLTKTQAIFLYLYAGLIFFLDYLIFKGRTFKQSLGLGIVWMLISFGTIFITFPAMWVSAYEVTTDIFREAFFVASIGNNSDGGDNAIYFRGMFVLLNYFNFVFAPVGFILILLTFKKLTRDEIKLYLYSFLFLFFYVLQMLIVFQKGIRYLSPIYFFVSIFAAFGIHFFVKNLKLNFQLLVILFITLSASLNLISIAPHYSARSELSEQRSWGALSIEAADYLNSKSGAVDLKAMVEPRPQSFRPFFYGKTYNKNETIPNNWTLNYLVLGPNAVVAHECFENKTLEKQIIFKNAVYWEIWKCN